MRKIVILVAVLALSVAGGLGLWYARAAGGQHAPYRTEKVEREDLLASFTATGTLEPEDIIDVGAQVAGQIKEFGVNAATAQLTLTDASFASLKAAGVPDAVVARLQPLKEKAINTQAGFLGEVGKVLDTSELSAYQAALVNSASKKGKPIDYSSEVEAGALLAKIDDSLYAAKVKQSEAMVAVAREAYKQALAKVDDAKSNVQVAQANLQTAQVNYDHAKRDWDRAQVLMPKQALAPADYDTYLSTFESTRAVVAQNKAAVAQAEVQVKEAEAAADNAKASIGAAEAQLAQDKINLGYTEIRAPVKGVIIDRRVTIGQTVQSSFNTPSLFLLARDLKRMKVWASVNEADVGHVHVGQKVTFTSDAFAGETFTGTVGLIRLNATMTNNVVTYTIEVLTDNPADKDHPNGKLYPYLTANLKFEVDRRDNALTVSNEALRWRPDPKQVAPDARAALAAKGKGRPADGGDGGKAKDGGAKHGAGNSGTVWVEDGPYVRPVKVKLGLTDGNRTELLDGKLEEGAVIVTGDAVLTADDGGSNPFTPQMFGGKKQ
jgi:HlyD family secretion protein